jgi:hypothetical protein
MEGSADMNRRNFFAMMAAPLLAPLARKSGPFDIDTSLVDRLSGPSTYETLMAYPPLVGEGGFLMPPEMAEELVSFMRNNQPYFRGRAVKVYKFDRLPEGDVP